MKEEVERIKKLVGIDHNRWEQPCSCDKCKNMCRVSCIGTPKDIEAIIDAGYADRLKETIWMVGYLAAGEEHIKTMSIKVIRYRLPSYWACPLINDDYTGLTNEECKEVKRFLEKAEGYLVDIDWETQGFYRCNDAGTLPGECADFIFCKCND